MRPTRQLYRSRVWGRLPGLLTLRLHHALRGSVCNHVSAIAMKQASPTQLCQSLHYWSAHIIQCSVQSHCCPPSHGMMPHSAGASCDERLTAVAPLRHASNHHHTCSLAAVLHLSAAPTPVCCPHCGAQVGPTPAHNTPHALHTHIYDHNPCMAAAASFSNNAPPHHLDAAWPYCCQPAVHLGQLGNTCT